MTSLKGKIAIVTGASRSKGIGAAISRTLAEAGADIFFTHWVPFDQEEGSGAEANFPSLLTEKIRELGVRCHNMGVDLSEADAPQKILDQCDATIGTPHILINNAAYDRLVDFRTLDQAILDKHYHVNNSGTILLSTEFAKRFELAYPGQKGGRIVFFVSKGPDPNNLAYIATKGALIALTEPLAAGLAPIGITVNAVDPGPTDTGWMDSETKNNLTQLFPTGRVGRPEDAAKLVRFLASEESEWITGQVLHSEGGFTGR